MASDIEELETTPLLANGGGGAPPLSSREKLYAFLEAKTIGGQRYETFVIVLIVVNVISFVVGSLFVEEYNKEPWAQRDGGICNNLCDALWFGNYGDNSLERLNLGATSILELITIAVFSVEYILRLYTCDLESEKYKGVWGRFLYIPTFFSLVDLASTVPFYIDAFVLKDTDVAGSAFLRMFRLLRMMKVEGRYDTALTMVDDVYRAQKEILGTALFIGVTTWLTTASLYYLAERQNLAMIYCGAAPEYCGDEVDTSLCEIDIWGMVDCSNAGCPPSEDNPYPCYNLYESIPMSSYYTLLNLFGEFPLISQHSVWGQIVGTFTAIIAVAVFALPVGIIGNGFEDEVAKRTHSEDEDVPIVERALRTEGFEGNPSTIRGLIYNYLHAQSSPGSGVFDNFINVLVIGTAFSFMIDTLDDLPPVLYVISDNFEFLAVCVFTVEYILRVYSINEDPAFQGASGLWEYTKSFLPLVDLLSFAPYWLEVIWIGKIMGSEGGTGSSLVKAFRLLRILRFEKYTHAFTSFDDVVSRNVDVLAITAFTAILFWIFFGAFLHFTERDNPDEEMASNYNTVPNAMWITLLNLSGESPLAQYSILGKIATGVLGLFATGVFGIPIGTTSNFYFPRSR